MKDKKKWQPELVYMDDSPLPSAIVPADKEMPSMLFCWEYKHTGEIDEETGANECDVKLHLYFDYDIAKDLLPEETIDQIRLAFGLEEVGSAAEKGRKISEKVENKYKHKNT